MGCCDDPTEPVKINRADLARAQEQYGNLVRDLFTSDPEKVMLKQLLGANVYLTELAALNAHYESVREQAIKLLKKESLSTLESIVRKSSESNIGITAQQRIDELTKDTGLLGKLFN
ncbi:MAG: hypothetical protein KAQ91_03825 [Methylococcales bacterium]|nr:hypothetical protein [Methylococcales bacterium]